MAIYGNMVVPRKPGGALPTADMPNGIYVPGQGVTARFSTEGASLASRAAEIQGNAIREQGRELGNLGRAIGNATARLEYAYLTYQDTKAQDAYNKYIQEEMQMRPEWDKLQGSNALDEQNGVIALKNQWQQDARARYMEGLNSDAQQMFRRRADQYDAGVNQWAMQKVNREMHAFQDSTDKGTIDVAAQRAMADPSYIPEAAGVIKATNERIGARKGLSREEIQAQTQKDVSAMLTNTLDTMVKAGNLEGAKHHLLMARHLMNADKYAILQSTLGNAYVARAKAQAEAGDYAGLRDTVRSAMTPVQGYQGVGSLAVAHESGGDPGNVSPDTSGSFSYGLFQFNSLPGGTAHKFMPFLAQRYPDLYQALGGGSLAVGSKAYNEAFRETGHGEKRDRMVQAQQQFLQQEYTAPAERKVSGTVFQDKFGGNAAYQEVLTSTAIQHGPGGASRIMREAWATVDQEADKQTQLEQFIHNVYTLRGRPGEFRTALSEKGSDSAREQFMSSMRNRYANEEMEALAIARGQNEGQSEKRSTLVPAEDLAQMQHVLKKATDLQAKEQARVIVQDVFARTADLTPELQKQEIYKAVSILPPDMRELVAPLVKKEFEFQKDARDADYGAEAAKILELSPRLSPSEKERAIDNALRTGKISQEIADKLRSANDKNLSRETPERLATFDRLLEESNQAIALGEKDAMTKTTDIDREFARGNLTPKQREELLKIRRNGGAVKNFGKDHLDKLYSDIVGEKNKKMPGSMYARLFNWALESGKPLDDDAIRVQIARENLNVAVEGMFFGEKWPSTEPLWEAESKGKKILGVKIPEHQEDIVKEQMRKRGFTEEQIADKDTREKFYTNIVYGKGSE
jgi:hypothetical protein